MQGPDFAISAVLSAWSHDPTPPTPAWTQTQMPNWLVHFVLDRIATSPALQYNALFKLGHMNGLFHLANNVVVLWLCTSKQIPKQLVLWEYNHPNVRQSQGYLIQA